MKTILVIDDESKILTIYTRLLIESGYVVRWAADAGRATNVLLREDIRLVLLDLRMPHIDGKTMHEIIREFDPSLKIIVASVFPIDKQRELVPDAFDYFDKSQGPSQLLAKIERAFG